MQDRIALHNPFKDLIDDSSTVVLHSVREGLDLLFSGGVDG